MFELYFWQTDLLGREKFCSVILLLLMLIFVKHSYDQTEFDTQLAFFDNLCNTYMYTAKTILIIKIMSQVVLQ